MRGTHGERLVRMGGDSVLKVTSREEDILLGLCFAGGGGGVDVRGAGALPG